MDPLTPQKQIGLTVARLRLQRELTQEGLADRAGLHAVMISRVETGRTDARVSTLIKLARGLDVNVSSLLEDLG